MQTGCNATGANAGGEFIVHSDLVKFAVLITAKHCTENADVKMSDTQFDCIELSASIRYRP